MIVGIQDSFIDYPNEPCTIVFTRKCRWDCKNCHNKRTYNQMGCGAKGVTIDYVLDYIENSKPLIKAATISGGEPTEYDDIDKLVKAIKLLNVKVKLDTNGSNPVVLRSLLRYVDVVAMDIKEDINDIYRYRDVANCSAKDYLNVLQSLSILSKWHDEQGGHLILRTTKLDDKIDFDKVEKSLEGYSYDEYVRSDKII